MRGFKEDMDRLISSIQFDHWVLVGAAPVCTVMSHPADDHHPQRCAMHRPPIVVGERFVDTVSGSIVKVWPDTYEKHRRIYFWLLYRVRVEAQKPNVFREWFHADWWYITDSKVGLLFVGDVNYPEIPAVELVTRYVMEKARRPLNAVLLPSFGGVSPPSHEVPPGRDPMLLANTVKDTAEKLKRMEMQVGGLPHPVRASWSDFEFLRLPSRKWRT